MLWRPPGAKILAYSEPVDMRKAFDGLVALTRQLLQEDPLSGNVFLFFNRRANIVKAIMWDRTGYCLFAKRLEQGKFRLTDGAKKQELSEQKLKLLLDGIELGKRTKMY